MPFVALQSYNGASSSPDANTDRLSFNLTNGAGNDRLVFVIIQRFVNSIRTVQSTSFNSVAGTVRASVGEDGGNAVSVGLLVFTESQLPATSGTYDIDVVWNNSALRTTAVVVEYSGISNQANPIPELESNSVDRLATTVAGPNPTIGNTLLNSSGRPVWSSLGGGEFSSLDETLAGVPSGMTLRDTANSAGDLPLAVASLDSAASNSENYQWEVNYGLDVTVDAVVTLAFSIDESAAPSPPTITGSGPDRATETTTLTVDSYDNVSGVTYNSLPLTGVIETSPTTITVSLPKGGAQMGVAHDYIVTDVNGSSAAFSAVFNPPAGSSFVTISQSVDIWENLPAGSQIVYENTTTPGGFSVSIDSTGLVTYGVGTPDGESFEAYSLDVNDSFNASVGNLTVIKGAQASDVAPQFASTPYNNLSQYSYGDALSITPNLNVAGTPAPTYSVQSGSLPAGVSLNTATGQITGTLNLNQSVNFTIRVSNSEGFSDGVVTFNVQATAPVFDSPAYDNASQYDFASPLNISPQIATQGNPAQIYSLISGNTPIGLSVDPNTGNINLGILEDIESYTFTVRASNLAGFSDGVISFNVNEVAPVFSSPGYNSLSSYNSGDTINLAPQFDVTPIPSVTYQVSSGSLPSGVSLTSSGNLTGTIQGGGPVSFQVRAFNSDGSSTTSVSFTVNQVPEVSYFPASQYTQNTPININPFVSEGFPLPTYSLVSGSLPSGLTLNTSSGAISGSTSVLGPVSITVRSSNSAGFDEDVVSFTINDVVLGRTYFEKLRQLGFTGALPEMQREYLKSQGFTGPTNEAASAFLRSLGYVGVYTDMLGQKASAEGYRTVADMWADRGLIPQ